MWLVNLEMKCKKQLNKVHVENETSRKKIENLNLNCEILKTKLRFNKFTQ